MEQINLTLIERDKKENPGHIRKKGMIPGVVYGKHMDPSIVSLDYKEFGKAFFKHSISSFINILSDGNGLNGKLAVIKEIQKDPVTEKVIHIDFHEVSMNEKIEIEATIHFNGKAEGVKLGGILEPIMRHILIKGFPKDIIDTINVDVSGLKVGDIVHVRDLSLPEGVEVMADMDSPVVMVAEPIVEEAAGGSTGGEETGQEQS